MFIIVGNIWLIWFVILNIIIDVDMVRVIVFENEVVFIRLKIELLDIDFCSLCKVILIFIVLLFFLKKDNLLIKFLF